MDFRRYNPAGYTSEFAVFSYMGHSFSGNRYPLPFSARIDYTSTLANTRVVRLGADTWAIRRLPDGKFHLREMFFGGKTPQQGEGSKTKGTFEFIATNEHDEQK